MDLPGKKSVSADMLGPCECSTPPSSARPGSSSLPDCPQGWPAGGPFRRWGVLAQGMRVTASLLAGSLWAGAIPLSKPRPSPTVHLGPSNCPASQDPQASGW